MKNKEYTPSVENSPAINLASVLATKENQTPILICSECIRKKCFLKVKNLIQEGVIDNASSLGIAFILAQLESIESGSLPKNFNFRISSTDISTGLRSISTISRDIISEVIQIYPAILCIVNTTKNFAEAWERIIAVNSFKQYLPK